MPFENKPFLEYLSLNKNLSKLEYIEIKHKKKKKVIGHSILQLSISRFKSFISGLINYLIEIYIARKYLLSTFKKYKSAANKKCLLIGNGPSQGHLSPDLLDKFKAAGNDTYGLNYWTENTELSRHIPSYMIFSDPDTFNENKDYLVEKTKKLKKYILDNHDIKIIVPFSMVSMMKSQFTNEIYGFCDSEFNGWKNTNPLLPRGYISMTLYKGIAWCGFLGYKNIYVIGMDNTFIKNIFSNKNNAVLQLDKHSSQEDKLIDLSQMYESIASRVDELSRLFIDLIVFKKLNIINLDIYSLTDSFVKLSIEDFRTEYDR